jgi:hypothetical protein
MANYLKNELKRKRLNEKDLLLSKINHRIKIENVFSLVN